MSTGRGILAGGGIFLLLAGLLSAELLWRRSIETEIAGAPAYFRERIILASKAGGLFCLSPDGSLEWHRDVNARIMAAPSLDEAGNIYVAALDKKIRCFNSQGVEQWQVELKAGSRATPLVIGNIIYPVDESGTLYVVDKGGKKILWQVELGLPVFSSPVFNRDKRRIIVPSKNFHVIAVGIKGAGKGKILWKFRTAGVIFSSPAVTVDDDIYITSMDHHIYKLSPRGQLLWKFRAGHWIIASPAIDSRGRVYFGSYDRCFYCLDRSGKEIWVYKGDGQFNASPVIDRRGTVYTGDSSGTFYAFDRRGGVLWTYKSDDFVRSAFTIFSPGKIVLGGGLDSFVYAFRAGGKLANQAGWPKILGNHRNSGYRDQ